jgi:long-subunit fatty acid transport protein
MIVSLRSQIVWLGAMVTCALLSGPAPLAAQSLLARSGLGLVSEPLDARARGLGGVELGLPETNLSLINPATIAFLPAAALHVTFQPDQFSAALPGADVSGTTSRFPLIHAALPLTERWALSVGYGSLLDQSWAAELQDTISLGETDVAVTDRVASRGGVAHFRVAAARRLGSQLSVGAGADLYTGSVRDTTIRSFESQTLLPATTQLVRSYSGYGFSLGAQYLLGDAGAIAASAAFGGTLDAETRDSIPVRNSYELPLRLALGGSGRVTQGLLIALSGNWQSWSSTEDGLAEAGAARDTWSAAGGVEWNALNMGGTTLPLRLGARYGTLPFQWAAGSGDAEWVREQAFTAGSGFLISGGAARGDLAVERGSRLGDGTFDESFWRLSLSLTVLGR